MTATTTDDVTGAARLAEAAAPGRSGIAWATILRVLSTLATCCQWAAVALWAQSLVDGFFGDAPGAGGRGALWLLIALVSAMASAAVDRGAAAAARSASERIAGAERSQLLRAALPAHGRAAAEPATLAEAALDLVRQIAGHLSSATPQKRSTVPSMLLVLILTAVVHWPAAIILVLATAMLPANMWLAGMLAKEGNDRYLDALQRLGEVVLDSFRGLPTLRRFRGVERRAAVIDRASNRLERANMSVLRRAFVSGAVMDVVVTLSIAVCATYIGMTLLGYVSVPGTAHLDLAGGLFVLLLCPLYFTPMRESAAGFHDREQAVTNAALLARIEASSRPAEAAGSESAGPAAAGHERASEPLQTAPEVVLSDIVIRDAEDGRKVVGVAGSLIAEAGRWTAIIGPSGAGKTTLLESIAGLRRPSSGSVLWRTPEADETPLTGAAAWIGQTTVILDATLAENLRLGAPDASDADLFGVLDRLGLGPLVAGLPEGLATLCGIGGHAFSAGETRRIAVARAMLRGARLWLLDEPTAHLDRGSEETVIRALREAASGCTVIAVTHSPELAAVSGETWEVVEGEARVASVPRAAPVAPLERDGGALEGAHA